MNVTAFDLAQRFVGLKEVPGSVSNPQILAMLQLDASWPQDDEVAWCSAFINYIAWLLRLPRSKSLMARSWLTVGRPIYAPDAKVGWDAAILSRGSDAPGPEVLDAPGHVGLYAGFSAYPANRTDSIYLLGGNQGDQVSIAPYPCSRILGLRRLWEQS